MRRLVRACQRSAATLNGFAHGEIRKFRFDGRLGDSNAIAARGFRSVKSSIDFVKQFLDGSNSPDIAEQQPKTHGDIQRAGERLDRAATDNLADIFGACFSELRFAIVEHEQEFFATIAADEIVGAN
jgi:hypothetical protein